MADSFPVSKNDHILIGYEGSTAWYVNNTRSGENLSKNHKRTKGKYLEGGSWLMYKRDTTHYGKSSNVFRLNRSTPDYKGRFYVNVAGADVTTLGDKNSQLNSTVSLGAKAYDALKPDNPDFTAASSLYELKEAFSPLHDRAKTKFRKTVGMRDRLVRERHWSKHAADQYVTYWFGWLPLAGDVVNFATAFNGRKARFDQLLRDEGKGVRRNRGLGQDPDIKTESSGTNGRSYNGDTMPLLHVDCYAGGISYTKDKQVISKKSWCAGKSKYLLPPGPRDDVWKKVLLNRILGWRSGNFTFEDIYQIMPWSWLVDYFSGIGDFIAAVSPGIADKVWFDYAYVMQQHEARRTRTCGQYVRIASKDATELVECFRERNLIRKTRYPATPFGFGLASPSLKQMSILGALGYSKLPPL